MLFLIHVQILNGSSRKLTPSHTTCDAFMNKSFAFHRDVSLGRLCSHESALELSKPCISQLFFFRYINE